MTGRKVVGAGLTGTDGDTSNTADLYSVEAPGRWRRTVRGSLTSKAVWLTAYSPDTDKQWSFSIVNDRIDD